MTDKCPYCGHAKATEGSEVYQCGVQWNEPENLVRTHNCYNREIARLRAVAEAAVRHVLDCKLERDYYSGIRNPMMVFPDDLEDALEASGYLQPLTPPSGER